MKLTTRQKNTLAKHQKAHGHTKAHMEYMKRKMREGVSFTEAHNMAMKRNCLLYTSPSPRDAPLSRMPSSA